MGERIVFKCKHKDCIYHSKHFLYSCDYSNYHEHTRVYGLPRDKWSAEFCDKYVSGKKKTKSREFKIPVPLDYEKIAYLYKRGLNDTEIAREMKCAPSKISDWRKQQNLKSNTTRSSRISFDTDKAQELYHKGWSDGEIGRALGCSSDTVRLWRKKSNLEARRHGGTSPTINWEYGRQLYDSGHSDTEMSALLKCRIETVRQWRVRNNLPVNVSETRKTHLTKAQLELIRSLHTRGLLDTEIAVILGCGSDTIYKKRRAWDLPTNNSGGRRAKPLLVAEKIEDGLMYDEPTGLWWVFRHDRIIGAGRDEIAAAKIFEE